MQIKHLLLGSLFCFIFLSANTQNLKPVTGENGLYGYIDSVKDKWVIPPSYISAGNFSNNGLAFVCQNKEKCGCIDSKGNTKVPFKYIYDINYLLNYNQNYRLPEHVPVFNDSGLLIVRQLMKVDKHWYYGYGLVNGEGVEVLPTFYNFIERTNTYYIVANQNNGKAAVVGLNGKFLIPEAIQGIETVNPNCFLIKKSGYRGRMTYFFRNNKNELLKPDSFSAVFHEKKKGYLIANKNGVFGLFDASTMNELLPFEYRDISVIFHYKNQILFVSKGDSMGFANTQGKMLTAMRYDYESDLYKRFRDITYFANPRLIVRKKGKYGLMDLKGKELSDFVYDEIQYPYSKIHFVLTVKKDKQYNFMDSMGNLLSKQWYTTVYTFNETFGIVGRNDSFACIDTKGKLLFPLRKTKLSYLNDLNGHLTDTNYVVYQEDSLFGICTIQGKIIIKAQYKEIYLLQTNHVLGGKHSDIPEGFIVKTNAGYRLLDSEGKALFTETFDSVKSDVDRYEIYKGGYVLTVNNKEYFINWATKKLIAFEDMK